MRSIAQFLSYMNDIDFKYVVLRNWDGLPHHVELGEHSDLDLLVYDLDHFLEVFEPKGLIRVYPDPRVQFKMPVGNSFIQIDARSIGDNYYPFEFQLNILKTREWNENGFWTPNPLHHRIGLAYHAVHHKGYNAYQDKLGNVTIEQLSEALSKSEIGWVKPDDPTVGSFNSYIKGATSVVSENGTFVEKKQYRFKEHDLISNEKRMLDSLNSSHFPRCISSGDDSIRIDHCGDPLQDSNLPEDWEEQLIEISRQLDESEIVHRDIRLDNLMVKDGVIKLVDFGWARKSDEPDGDVPDLLGYPFKCPLGFNDKYSMKRIIKHFRTQRETLCAS